MTDANEQTSRDRSRRKTMYRNSLRLSTRFGIVLLVFVAAGTVMWLGLLLDEDMGAFDPPGLVVLGLNVLFLALSLLFLGRVRWVRPAASFVLHGVSVGFVVVAVAVMCSDETIGTRMLVVAFALLAVGLAFAGILTLHGDDMRDDLARTLESQRAPTRRSRKRRIALLVVSCIVLFLSWTAWRIVPLLLAQPTITVDYLAEANRLNKPADYDPNLNAAPHYDKLFAGFTPLPDELEEQWKAWLADLTSDELVALEQWASSNDSSLRALASAARCPYWWFELTAEDGALCGVKMPYAEEMRRCAWAFVLLAKYRASQGQVDAAIGQLMDMHMIGVHRARGGTLVEQLSGLAVCRLCYDSLLDVLDRCSVDTATLRLSLETLEARLPQLDVPRFDDIERLYGYDSFQRSFSDDGHGSGRLIPCLLYAMKKDGGLYSPPLSYLDAVWICATHPDRARTIRLFDECWRVVSALADQTPWELYSHGMSVEARLDELLAGNYLLRSSARPTAGCIRLGWQHRVYGRAVVTILAVLARKAEKGQWPASLGDLVAEGYLREIPMDPYSNEPLVYKVTEDNFVLYSVAENFRDDGGDNVEWDESASGGDRVFWPVDLSY